MASIKVELRLGWLSLLGAAAVAYYMRPSDESFRPVLSEFIKKTVGLPSAKQQSGSLLNAVASKIAGMPSIPALITHIADVAVTTVAEHGINPEITDYYVCKVPCLILFMSSWCCKLARVPHLAPCTGQDTSEMWVGAFGRWFRIPKIASRQVQSQRK